MVPIPFMNGAAQWHPVALGGALVKALFEVTVLTIFFKKNNNGRDNDDNGDDNDDNNNDNEDDETIICQA
jgi:hypothetical protein